MKDCFKSTDGYWAEEHGIIPNDETSKCLHNLAVIELKLANNGQLDDEAKEKMKENALNDANQAKHMKARLYDEILAQHPSVIKSQYLYEVITENKNDHVEPQLEAQLSFFGIEMQGGF